MNASSCQSHASSWFKVIALAFMLCSYSEIVFPQTGTALVVDQVTGKAEYRTQAADSWRPVTKGSELAVPVEVKTQDATVVTLHQGDSSFIVRENSHLLFSSEGARPLKMIDRVKQWIGTTVYKVEKSSEGFRVETPLLAATVKGTEFVVVSTEEDAYVSLREGVLEVEDFQTGAIETIHSGDVFGSSGLAHDAQGRAVKQIQSAETNSGYKNIGQAIASERRNVQATDKANNINQDRGLNRATKVAADSGLSGINRTIEAQEKRSGDSSGTNNQSNPPSGPPSNPSNPPTNPSSPPVNPGPP